MADKKMNSRIEDLRKKTREKPVTISHERAQLVTSFYETYVSMGESITVQRALCLKHILENKKICIDDNELIVGERGPEPKAVPTYPEICLHSLNDLEILNSRPKVAYKVSEETKRIYAEKIIPFWKGKTIREKIFNAMDDPWIDAFNAGMFTEFQEQRSPGHTAGGDLIYQKGFNDLKQEIRQCLGGIDFFKDSEALEKQEVLKSLDIAADALIVFAFHN
ncbi:hypothetical protein ABF87_10875 [Nitrosomonas sp. JL21]|uniref:pyruvate formate lyase family protein n=1 Tax=Nitrosomonas sp. JL21 TaxID=153949 RepID=UPI0013684623|nr:pyruvate formate lyase family protein [Nitrosomonas sp. JL21]MXS78451.1 hypothetical protein [Nitrosomonas sp. JL21]